MEIVSGRTGSPHVTSQQFRQLVEGTVGQESYILTSGENLEPELAANNILKIRSGMMSHHGNISSIKIGTYDEVELTNGSQGMKRIDLVVNRYTRNAETNVEANNWVVITGTPVASDPAVPAYTVGNLQEGDLTDDCPVFEVHYDGLNVTEIKKLLDVADNLGKMKTELAELNGKINHNSNKHILIGKWSSAWNLSDTSKNIGSKKAAIDNEYYKTTTGADSAVTVKKSGLYYVSMYAQGSAASGASASIQAQVVASATVVDDAYVLFGAGYSYNGLSANINIGRVVFLQAGTVLTPQLKKSSASGAASTTGSSYMEVVHIY